MRRALQRDVLAFLRSDPPFNQVSQLSAKAPESGTVSGVESQFALLLEAFASLDASTLGAPGCESGNPGQTLPATTPWTVLASPESEEQNQAPFEETGANPEKQTEESAAEDSPAGWAASASPIVLAAPPVPVIVPSVPLVVEAQAALSASHNGPQSGGTIADPQDEALVTAKALGPPAPPIAAPASGLLRVDASAGRHAGTTPQANQAQQDAAPADPSIEAFAVELMDRTGENKTPASESVRVRPARLDGTAPDAPEPAGIRIPALTEPAIAESTSPAAASERRDDKPEAGQQHDHPRRTGSYAAERENQVVPEHHTSAHPGERSTQTVSMDNRVKEQSAETPAPLMNGTEKSAARPGAESARQIEALRFGGVNLGRGGAVHDVEIRIPTAETPVDVRLTSRGGTVDVSVRVADPQLAQDLRTQLPRLLETLEARGYESNSAERRSETAELQPPPPARLAYNVDSEQQQRRRDQQPFRHRSGSRQPSQGAASEEFRIEPDIRITS